MNYSVIFNNEIWKKHYKLYKAKTLFAPYTIIHNLIVKWSMIYECTDFVTIIIITMSIRRKTLCWFSILFMTHKIWRGNVFLSNWHFIDIIMTKQNILLVLGKCAITFYRRTSILSFWKALKLKKGSAVT